MGKDDDDNVTEIKDNKPSTPSNELKKAFENEWKQKLADVRKRTVAAIRVASAEKRALPSMRKTSSHCLTLWEGYKAKAHEREGIRHLK